MSDQKLQTAIFITALLAGAAMLLGCSSTPPVDPPVIPDVTTAITNAETHASVAGVFCGLTMTSPQGDNDCPGCDIDARTLAADAESEGVKSVVLLNAQCTWSNIKATVFKAAQGLPDDSMLVLGLSGHGTQIPDDDGDEADGMDEALCLFRVDGTTASIDIVRDDRVLAELIKPLWALYPTLDLLLITDTCHSEGNFRALWNWVTRKDPRQLELFTPEELAATVRTVSGGLAQIAMCRENSYSYGASDGGTGTQSLLQVRRGDIGRHAAYLAMLPFIDTDQEPQWVEYGTVTERLRNGRFWK